MAGNSLRALKGIVDQLGPNMWLELDRVSFPWFFGYQLDSSAEARAAGIAAANAFADENEAAFIFDPDNLTARFGRAYFKKDDDG